MATVPRIDDANLSFDRFDANAPFAIDGDQTGYDGGADELRVVIGPGRARWFGDVTYELTADQTTFTLASPAASTTYHVWLDYNGGSPTIDVDTVAPASETSIDRTYLGSVTTASDTSVASTSDERGLLALMDTKAGGPSVVVDTFTASGTWTKPEGALAVEVYVVGGGGGGGSNEFGGGGGGGGGGGLQAVFPAADAGASETVTVGAGGTGGAAAPSSGVNPGGDGGQSSFGSLVVVGGGAGSPGDNGDSVGGDGGGYLGGGGAKGATTGRDGGPDGFNGESGGGGGGFPSTTNNDAGYGGNSHLGGGGGGGGMNTTDPPTGLGGTSTLAGNGGDGAESDADNGQPGAAPGGGGGGAGGNNAGGDGARGEVVVVTYL